MAMPAAGKKWRHIIINSKGSWLHGDPRGFRHRGHRIHSSGNYKKPPPAGEHFKLLGYQIGKSRPEARIAWGLRRMVSVAIRKDLSAKGHRVLAIAVGKVHTHVLVELPDNILRIRAIIGDAKRVSSRAIKRYVPGSVWAAGGTYKPVKSLEHQREAYKYILYRQGPDAWTWSFRDRDEDGKFRRARPQPKRPHAGAE
jgi:hypothetical protein